LTFQFDVLAAANSAETVCVDICPRGYFGCAPNVKLFSLFFLPKLKFAAGKVRFGATPEQWSEDGGQNSEVSATDMSALWKDVKLGGKAAFV